MTWVEGIDVSKWQNPPVRPPAGCKFAIIKASQGGNSRDKRMAAHHDAFGRDGVARGAYHYYDFSSTPERNADNFLAATSGRTWELPHALDAEHGGTGNKAANAATFLTFLRRIEAATGRVPFVYTYASWWNANVAPDAAFQRYPLWIARYPNAYRNGAAPPANATSTPARPWTSWAIWQFSTTNDQLDRNVCTPAVFRGLTGGPIDPPTGELTVSDISAILARLDAQEKREEQARAEYVDLWATTQVLTELVAASSGKSAADVDARIKAFKARKA